MFASIDRRGFQNTLRTIGFEVKLKPFIQRTDGSAKGDWDVGITLDAIVRLSMPAITWLPSLILYQQRSTNSFFCRVAARAKAVGDWPSTLRNILEKAPGLS